MAEAEIKVPEEYIEAGKGAIAEATSFKVVTEEDYMAAGVYGKTYTNIMKGIKEYFKPRKDRAKQVHSDWVAAEKEALAPYEKAVAILKSGKLAYEREQERRRQLIEEEQRRKIREEQERKEAEAKATGVEIEPPTILPEDVVVNPTYTKQGQTRKNWKAKVVDQGMFLNWVIKTGNVQFIEPDMKALVAEAKAVEKDSTIPGVEFYNDAVVVF